MTDADVRAAAVRDAVEAARTNVLADRNAGTYWGSDLSVGAGGIVDLRLTINYGLLLDRLGVREDSKRRAVEYALSRRDPDGGWGNAAANFGGLLLLRRVDPEGYAEEIAAVEAEISEAGMSLTDDVEGYQETVALFQTKLFYALLSDEYTAAELFPDQPPLAEYLLKTPAFTEPPGLLAMMPDRVLAALQRLPGADDGIDPDAHALNPELMDSMLSMGVLYAVVHDEVVFDSQVEYLLAGRLRNGIWKTSIDNVFGALALSTVGYDADDPEIARVVDWLADHRQDVEGRIVNYRLPIWDTAFSIRALIASGVPADDEAIQDAARWLAEARTADPSDVPLDDVLGRPAVVFRPEDGDEGWGYRPYMYSDWDDTGVALSALAEVEDRDFDDVVALLERTQNDDGSWSAFVTDFDPLDPEDKRRVLEDLDEDMAYNLFFDHPGPGVTAHVLDGLAAAGRTADDEVPARAIEYVRQSQSENGLWLGVWGVGYTYGTGHVLRTLSELDARMDVDWVQAAVDALLAVQDDDGGWGEDTRYDPTVDPDEVPYDAAESVPEQTAWALDGLLAAGVEAGHPAVEDAVAYLLDAQEDDGSWPVNRVLYNVGSYEYLTSAFTQATVLGALARYAGAAGVDVSPAADAAADESADDRATPTE